MRPPKPVSSCRPISIHSSESRLGAATIMSSSFFSLASCASGRGYGVAETFQRPVRMGVAARGSGGLEGGFDKGGGEAFLLRAGLGEAGLEAVAERHQFVDFGDDAVLFGEGGKRKSKKRYAVR